jgi:hypothetical protein
MSAKVRFFFDVDKKLKNRASEKEVTGTFVKNYG